MPIIFEPLPNHRVCDLPWLAGLNQDKKPLADDTRWQCDVCGLIWIIRTVYPETGRFSQPGQQWTKETEEQRKERKRMTRWIHTADLRKPPWEKVMK